MSSRDLGEKSGVAFETINKFENGRPMRESTKAKLALVLEGAGIEILNGDAPGARLAIISAAAFEANDGTYKVAVGHQTGAPLRVFTVSEARARALSARTIGQEHYAEMLEAAARDAERGILRGGPP